jgi:preprotein translocase subunit SecG
LQTSFRAAGPRLYNDFFQVWNHLMLFYLLTVIYVVICFVLMLVILLQQGKGGDIASAFGGGSSQTAFGARSGATVLSRATTITAVLFMVGAIALGIIGQGGGGRSVVGGRNPLQQPSTPAPARQATPATPAQTRPATPPPAPPQQQPAK